MTAALIGAKSFAPERVATLRTGLTIGTPSDVRSAIDDLGVERDLQRLRRDRDLRQLLRHTDAVAARAP